VAQTPILQWLLLLGITVIAVGVWFALLPRYARDVLDAGATGYGSILSARGLGGLVGVITLIVAGRVKRLAAVLMACSLGFATLVIAFAFSSSIFVATILAFGLGIVFIWWPSTLRTAFQLSAIGAMQGRVMSLFSLIGQLLTLGWFVGGVLSEAIGAQAAMVIVAFLCAGANILAYIRSPALRIVDRDGES
jgi:predicted MFS family arabinose efflux permease